MKALHRKRQSLFLAFLLSAGAWMVACSSNARQLLDRAESAWRNGGYDEAIRDNLQLYEMEKKGKYAPQALLNIGNIYYLNLRRLNRAIEYYDRLAQEFPDSPEVLHARRQLASIYTNEEVIRDLDQAIGQYNRLLEAEELPDRNEILYQRADAFYKKGDYSRALRELSSLEESGIQDRLAAQVSLRIGSIYEMEKRFPEAIEAFRKVMVSKYDDCRRRAALNLTETYENLYDFDKAIETIRKLDPTPENDKYIRGEVERLNAKRRRVERGSLLNWSQPRANEPPSSAPKTPRPAPATKK
jgi:tetratricopeptide (TPR) repeat protein